MSENPLQIFIKLIRSSLTEQRKSAQGESRTPIIPTSRKFLYGGIVGSVFLFAFLCYLTADPSAKRDELTASVNTDWQGKNPMRSEIITADYYPFKKGAKAIVYTELDLPNYGPAVIKNHHSYSDDGQIFIRTMSVGKMTDGEFQELQSMIGKVELKTKRWRINGGYVETRDDNDSQSEWEREIKIGATIGDSWVQEHGHGIQNKYSVKRFGTYWVDYYQSNRPCVVITADLFIDGKPSVTTERIYVKGVGFVEQVAYSNGKLEARIKVDMLKRDKNYSTSEMKLFE